MQPSVSRYQHYYVLAFRLHKGSYQGDAHFQLIRGFSYDTPLTQSVLPIKELYWPFGMYLTTLSLVGRLAHATSGYDPSVARQTGNYAVLGIGRLV